MRERLTVAVLNYNAAAKLKQCVTSILTHLPHCPVVVWDNASNDDSVRMIQGEFPQVRLFASPHNLLFPEGCNHLIQACQTKYVLLMNADIFLEDARILEVVVYVERHPELIAVSPSVRDAGRLRHLAHGAMTPMLTIARDSFVGKLLRQSRWYRTAMYEQTAANEIFRVPKITNCCCVLVRQPFLDLGGFHAKQLLYWSEEDFSLRAARQGYQQAVYGRCTVVHEHGSSTATLPHALIRAIFIRDRLSYMRRHFGLLATLVVETVIFLRPKAWRAVFDWYYLARNRKRLARMQAVVEEQRRLRLQRATDDERIDARS